MTKQRTSLLVLGTIALAATGCARNAALDVELQLPAATSATARYAFVQFARPPISFGEAWTSTADFEGTRLSRTDGLEVGFSLLSEDFENDLLVRVRFCESPRCGDDRGALPTLEFRLERPFHVGRRTRWAHEILAIPDSVGPVTVVGRCRIAGCIAHDYEPVSFCREDGSHFCDAPGTPSPTDAGGPDSGRRVPDAGDRALPDATPEDR